jgi:hypothetical protein
MDAYAPRPRKTVRSRWVREGITIAPDPSPNMVSPRDSPLRLSNHLEITLLYGTGATPPRPDGKNSVDAVNISRVTVARAQGFCRFFCRSTCESLRFRSPHEKGGGYPIPPLLPLSSPADQEKTSPNQRASNLYRCRAICHKGLPAPDTDSPPAPAAWPCKPDRQLLALPG